MYTKNVTIIIATKDNDEEMGRFYTEVLGFTKNEMGGYEKNNITIYFDRHSKALLKSIEPFRHMLTMEVDDINAAVSELKSKGVTFVRESGQEEWGGWFATFEDPDGNYLQLFQIGQ